jgi:hypothetical protein
MVLCRDIVAVYCGNRQKLVSAVCVCWQNAKYRLFDQEVHTAYSSHSALVSQLAEHSCISCLHKTPLCRHVRDTADT